MPRANVEKASLPENFHKILLEKKKKKNNTSQPQLLVQLLPYLRTVYSNPVPSTTQVCRATDSFLFLVYVLCVPTQWQLD